MKTREPAVAGTFYPGSPEKIKDLISKLDSIERPNFDGSLSDIHIIGGIVPHAGYIYSGNEAVHFFSRLSGSAHKYETVILLNPNHRGHGPAYATDINDSWKTPMGNYEVDKELITLLGLPENESAHRLEHSAEVMLPFLQYYLPYDIKILPISIMKQVPDVARELAQMIRKGVKETGREVLVIASSDFCHFMQPDAGYKLDSEVIDSIVSMNVDSVFGKITEKNITVCGYGPIMTLMEYVKISYNDVKVKVLARGNSAKSKPLDKVVDYVTILFYSEKQ